MKPIAQARHAAELRSLVAAIVRRFSLAERADVDCCGLTVAQAATLEALQSRPMRLGALAQSLGITPSTLTRNLARLESDRLVVREADPEDARAARVRLTAAGERAACRVEEQELEFARGILDRLGSEREPRGPRRAVGAARCGAGGDGGVLSGGVRAPDGGPARDGRRSKEES